MQHDQFSNTNHEVEKSGDAMAVSGCRLRKSIGAAALVCALAVACGLAGCSSQSNDSPAADASQEASTSASSQAQSAGEGMVAAGANESAATSGAYVVQGGDSLTNMVYTATGVDESALLADGVTASINQVTVEKSAGDASSADDSSFYGVNAGIRAIGGAHLSIINSLVEAEAKNATGVFAYDGATIDISYSTVNVTGGGAGGIQVAGGGILNATDLDVTSASKAAIRSDRGGGTLTVNGGTYTATGESGCPAIYSTADITATDATLTSTRSKAVIIEGKNSVALKNCSAAGNDQSSTNDSIHANVLLYQSMSGDASTGTSTFSDTGGSLACKSGSQFFVTNTNAVINLDGVKLENSSDDSLLIASASRWGKDGSNGGNCTLNATGQTLEGSIAVDSISSLALNLASSDYTGAINTDGAAGTVDVTLDGTSTWTLTGDSYISSFAGDAGSIVSNGHTVYVNGAALA